MRCVIDRYEFSKAVDFVSQFTLVASAKPVLENVKLSITNNSISLTASDGEAMAEVSVKCESHVTTQVLVNAAKLQKILKSCDKDFVELDIEGDDDNPTCLQLKNYDDEFSLPAVRSDLPTLPSVSQYHLTLPSGLLTRANSLTVAIDKDNTRYQLGGVWFNVADSKLEIATADGRRMMYYSTPVEGDATGSLIIPANVIKRIAKLEEAELSYNENMFLLVSGNTKVAGRMIEGRFPNVHKILEASEPCNARREMDRTLFIGALKRASLMTDKEQYGVSFCMSGRCLILRAQAASVGKAVVRFDCETEWGDANFEVILDVNMTREMMESLCSETIEMQTHGKSGAVFFKSNGVACVQMPMSR